jgi:hypothetical protein
VAWFSIMLFREKVIIALRCNVFMYMRDNYNIIALVILKVMLVYEKPLAIPG